MIYFIPLCIFFNPLVTLYMGILHNLLVMNCTIARVIQICFEEGVKLSYYVCIFNVLLLFIISSLDCSLLQQTSDEK